MNHKHTRLPGTIFSAAEEIRKVGGKALPIQTDIRFEDQVWIIMTLLQKDMLKIQYIYIYIF